MNSIQVNQIQLAPAFKFNVNVAILVVNLLVSIIVLGLFAQGVALLSQ